MPISFNSIPTSQLRLPLFWAEVDPSQAGTFANYQRALIVGYKNSTAGGAADVQVRCSSPDQAKTLAGRGSQLAHEFEAWFKNDQFSETWVTLIDEPSAGNKATGAIAVTASSAQTGTLSIYIGGRKIVAAVTQGDSAATIAASINAAINAALDLPVVATVSTNTVTLTARHKGLAGNGIDIRANYLGRLGGEELPTGVTLAITAMTGGTGVPDLTNFFANLGDQPFDTVVFPFTDTASLNLVDAEWDFEGDAGRWSWMRQIFGHVYTAHDGTVGELQSFGAARNGSAVTAFGYRGSPTPAWERAAMYAALAHRALMNDPARPLHTLPLKGMMPAVPELRFTLAEQNSLAFDGISVCDEHDDGTCRIKTSFTMWQKNTHGLDDNAFLKVQTKATLAYVLRSLRFRILQKFPRHKLANDGTRYGPGQAIVTPKSAKAEITSHYRELEFRGLVENADLFEQHLIVERNVDDPNRLDVLYPPDLVNQLDVFAVLAQFRLQYPASLPDQALPIA